MGRQGTLRDRGPVKISKRGHASLKLTTAGGKKRTRAQAAAQESHSSGSGGFLKDLKEESIVAHALATFGSKEKTQHWMNRPNPLFQGKTPLEVMRTDPVRVEAELVRIDHGVYV